MIPNQITRTNKTMKTVLTALAVGLLGCNVLCQQAKAQPPITGTISFTGDATASGFSLGPPVMISFDNDPADADHWQVTDLPPPSGDFASVAAGTQVMFNSFSFTGDGPGAVLSAPVVHLWSFSLNNIDYSFDLDSLDPAQGGFVHSGPNNTVMMGFKGTGFINATGFASTPAILVLSGDGFGGIEGTIQSEAHTIAVPEAGTISLLALGLVILGGQTFLRTRQSSFKA
jgi:hypothetical protein